MKTVYRVDDGTLPEPLDGNDLPAMTATKKGGVPATGTPSGKYLKDDGTWASPVGGGAQESHIIFVSLGAAQLI